MTRPLAYCAIAALSIALAEPSPAHAQATESDAARERVAAWNDRCGTLWAELQPWGRLVCTVRTRRSRADSSRFSPAEVDRFGWPRSTFTPAYR